MAVVLRAALETYLAFFFVYIERQEDEEECQFRHDLWVWAGLRSRQAVDAQLEESRVTLRREERDIAVLRERIEASSRFATWMPRPGATDTMRWKALRADWKLGRSWVSLAKVARFGGFTNLYRHLCGYSHSGYASIMQLRSASGGGIDRDQSFETFLGVGLRIMGHVIRDYTALFPETRRVLEAHPQQRDLAELYLSVSETWFREKGV